jgi:hypothetical protein
MGDVTTEEKHQLLDEQLNDGLIYKPKFVDRFFTSNIVNRSLSYLMAWHKDSGVPVKLSATPSGSLLVATTGGGKTINDTKAGTAGNAYSAAIDFDSVMVGVDIMAFDNSIMVQRSVDGVTYNDEFEVVGGTSMYFEADTFSVKVKNKVADSNGRYQFIGWK